MPEPSLSEISNVNIDPSLSGIAPTPVIDNSKLVDQLNNNGRYHAQQVAQQYNQFLQNKSELFKNIGDIEGLETLPEDRQTLNKQAADIFSDILKDPTVIRGGAGFGDVMSKISKFKNSAMASKMSYLDTKANNIMLGRMPAMDTEGNRAAIAENNKLPLDQRKTVVLSIPTILDQKGLAEGIFKDNPLVKSTFSTPIQAADGTRYIQSGTLINPKAFLGSWDQVVKGGSTDKNNKDLVNAVKFSYDNDPNKAYYEKNGGMEKYWADRGKQFLDAYTQGAKTDADGNFIINPKYGKDDAYNQAQNLLLGQERLAQKSASDRDKSARDWAKYGLSKQKLNESKADDIGAADVVLNEAASIINNGTPIKVVNADRSETQVLRISDPTLLQAFGNVDSDGKKKNVPDALNYNPETNQATLLYFDDDGEPNTTGGNNYKRQIPLDQRTWMKVITKRSFPNKDIGKINSLLDEAISKNGNSLYNLSQKVKESQSGQGATKDANNGTKLKMVNPKDYYYNEKNKESQSGNVITYKDGTMWEIKNGKFIQIR